MFMSARTNPGAARGAPGGAAPWRTHVTPMLPAKHTVLFVVADALLARGVPQEAAEVQAAAVPISREQRRAWDSVHQACVHRGCAPPHIFTPPIVSPRYLAVYMLAASLHVQLGKLALGEGSVQQAATRTAHMVRAAADWLGHSLPCLSTCDGTHLAAYTAGVTGEACVPEVARFFDRWVHAAPGAAQVAALEGLFRLAPPFTGLTGHYMDAATARFGEGGGLEALASMCGCTVESVRVPSKQQGAVRVCGNVLQVGESRTHTISTTMDAARVSGV